MCIVYTNLGKYNHDGSGTRPKMGLRQVEQGFSSFFVKFLSYLTIFQTFTASSIPKIALNPFLHGSSESQVSGTQSVKLVHKVEQS